MQISFKSLAILGLVAAAILPICCQAAPSAPDDKAAINAVAHDMIDAFNKGDIAGFKSMLAEDVSVVDDMPPFEWSGRNAIDAWLAAVDRDNRLNRDAGGFSVLGPPTFLRLAGDRAYAVYPDRFSYKRAGRQIREDATAALVMRKTGAGWRVVSIAYSADRH